MPHALKVGFVPLADAAPVIMAKELGYFEKYDLDVELVKVSSWARMRDLLAIDHLQAGHLLAPMVIASVMGLEPGTPPLETMLSLNLNGNAITVSNALFAQMHEVDRPSMMSRPIKATAIKKIVQARKISGSKPLTFAMVYPFSSHNYQLRYWLANAGLNPDRDLNLIVVPPPQVMDYMKAGIIDGYCVGEPWNYEAVNADVGVTLITSREMMGLAPEKVLGVTQDWARDNNDAHMALVSAILEACKFLQSKDAFEETASILSHEMYVNVHRDGLFAALSGLGRKTAGGITEDIGDFNVFHRYAANFPWRSHAAWFICQMIRWGQCDGNVDVKAMSEAAYRSDKFRDIAQKLNIAVSDLDWKVEGQHPGPWILEGTEQKIVMTNDQSLDKRTFDIRDAGQYVESFQIHNMQK